MTSLFKQLAVSAAFFCLFSSPVFSQDVYYTGVEVPVEIKPAYPQYSNYTSFDVTLLPFILSNDTRVQYENLPYNVKIGNLKKVTESGDFHVIAKLFGVSGRLTSKSTASANIRINVKVFDKYGLQLSETSVNRDAFYISLGKHLNDDETRDPVIVNTLIIQNAIDTALAPFNKGLTGGTVKKEIIFGALKGVKKMEELKEFSKQQDELFSASRKDNALFIAKLKEYEPYWEKMTAYAGEGEVNEVKRAACQNLVMSSILTGNYEKAKNVLEIYKPIDKTVSMLLGVVKIRYSADAEKLLKEFTPVEKNEITSSSVPVKLTQLTDEERFLVIENGTVTLNGKRSPGTYTGTIRIAKLPVMTQQVGNIKLEKKTDDVFIEGKDAAGNAKSFSASSADLVLVKDANNSQYAYRVFGSAFGIGGTGTILKSTFSSDKVVVFRSEVPKGDDYLVMKAGDTEGYISSVLKGRKKLINYFDCPALDEKYKNKEISEEETVEKIAEIYSNCK